MENRIKIKVRDLFFYYSGNPILQNINIDIHQNSITSISGPSGQGKSSFLTVLNRLWENIEGAKVKGQVKINFGNGFEDIYRKDYSLPCFAKKSEWYSRRPILCQ